MVRSGLATCDCNIGECQTSTSPSVCGSDGRTYLSACHLRAQSCRSQADVVVQSFGPCSKDAPLVRRGSRSTDKSLSANYASRSHRSPSTSSDKPISVLNRRSTFSFDRSRSVDAISRSPAPRKHNVKFLDEVTKSRTTHNRHSVSSDDRPNVKFQRHNDKLENPNLACVDILPPVGYR